MKKITFSLLLFLAIVTGTYAQVQVGEGTNQLQNVPFEPYYNYSYCQSIYLASEINASGDITGIKWYYSGTSNLSSNQQLVVYMGHTDKTEFEDNLDFVSIDDLTQVYSGGITAPTDGAAVVEGWVTITFPEPFPYDGINNLVIAVDENQEGYNNSTDDFHNTQVTGNRSIYAFSDLANFLPADPTNNLGQESWSINRGVAAFVPKIIFEGITQQCTNVTGLSAANATISTADLSWQAGEGQTAWEVLVLEVGSEAPTPDDAGAPVVDIPAYQATELADSSDYVFYVRANCGDGLFSGWSGGYTFKTLCTPFGEFSENFDSTDILYGTIPDCWFKIQNTSSSFAYVQVDDYSSSSAPKNIGLYNSDDANAQLYLITPQLTDLPADTHRIKFKAVGSTGYTLLVGTMSDPTNPSTFTLVETINLTGSYADYNVTFNNSTTDGFVAFKHGLGGTYRTIRIDNFVWEPIPTDVPECVSDIAIATNENCGNYATGISWSEVEGVDGYKISIGTTPGGDYIVENLNLGNVLSYSFSGNPGTDYYYTIKAYNAAGDAVECMEDVFTTVPDGCYCPSVPTSHDNGGVTEVVLGTTVFAIETASDVHYYDLTEVETADLIQGINNNSTVTFATGYTYNTNIWIDLDDNYTFTANELVYQGESSSANPTTLTTSFVLSDTANLGMHRMRIGTADSGQATPNPCYSGSWGVTLDFMVNILPKPDCMPPTTGNVTAITANTASLNWVSEGTLFNIEYAEAGTAQGDGTVVTGVAANTYALTDLNSQADYHFYVQTDCGSGDLSPWIGPFTFKTACDPFGEFTEQFTTDNTITAPECWSTYLSSTSQFASINVYYYNDYVSLSNDNDTNPQMYLITPSLTDLPAGTHRVKFWAASWSNVPVIVGTMTDPADPTTFTQVSSIPLPNDGYFDEYIVNFTDVTADTYVAFKHGGGLTYATIYIDNVIWEPAPTELPGCVEDFNVAINDDCGNYASSFEWSAVENADGYKVTIGTTPGGNDVVDNQNIGNIVAATFTGDFNTTYYYKIVPFNGLGDAVGCEEGSFTTAATGCYCESIPESFDNSGITNVVLGDYEFSIEAASYVDMTEQEIVPLALDTTEDQISITFGTGYTYDVNVWIDFDDDYNFDSTDLVYKGVSGSANPTTLTGDFTWPATAATGVHRMRIGTADSGQFTPAPCYSGTWGVTVDFTVEIFESLSTNQFAKGNMMVYPNPVSDVLNLSYTQNITNVSVFNILGQEIITKKAEATQSQIDMSDLAAGTYLVKITAGDETKTVKVLKK